MYELFIEELEAKVAPSGSGGGGTDEPKIIIDP